MVSARMPDMQPTIQSYTYGKEGQTISQTPPTPLYYGLVASYGNISLADLPTGFILDREKFHVKNGVIPNATIRITNSWGEENALVLEQKMGDKAPLHSIIIGGESDEDHQQVSDNIAREGIRIRRPEADGTRKEIVIFISTPRQENMALLKNAATERLRSRFASTR